MDFCDYLSVSLIHERQNDEEMSLVSKQVCIFHFMSKYGNFSLRKEGEVREGIT